MLNSNCPVCGGTLSERGPRSIPVCEDCGRVNNGTHVDEGTDANARDSQSEAAGLEAKSTDWTDSIEVTDSTDEQLVILLSYTDKIGHELGAEPDLRDQAAELIIQAWENRLLVGHSKEVAAGACWYITFREHGDPCPVGVVADAVNETSSRLHSFRGKITKDLDIALRVAQPCEYLPFLRSRLELSATTADRAQEILSESTVSGNPAGIAAGGVYVAAQNGGQDVTMREAAQTVRLSKETIWQRVEDLRVQ